MCALTEACDAIEHDDAARAVVLAAAGRHFCAGLPRAMAWPPSSWPDAIAAMAGVGKPVVACLDGTVAGWGVALALGCEIRLASYTALMRLDDGRRGWLDGDGCNE